MKEAFIRYINEHQKEGMVVCEIGCWTGETTVNYLNTIKNNKGKAIIIDWFSGNEDIKDPSHIHGYNPLNSDNIYNTFINNINKTGAADIAQVIRAKSQDAASLIPDNSIDICFVDADHLYSAVMNDIRLYFPKVKKGGIICGDDCEDLGLANTFTEAQKNMHYLNKSNSSYSGCHPGVIQAVWDCFGSEAYLIPDYGPHKIPMWVKNVN